MTFRTQLRTSQAQVFRLGHLISVLQMSAEELDGHLAETAQENPCLLVRPRSSARPGTISTTDILETTAADEATSLPEHVLKQLAGPLSRGGDLARVIIALIEELEPSGWLGRPLDQLAAQLGLGEVAVEAALSFVQRRVEPAGLFARDLRECLRLQLEDREELSDQMQRVLDHLPALERGGLNALVRATGLPPDEVQDCLATIRSLDPKPGARLQSDPTLSRTPDVTVTRTEAGWSIRLNSSLDCDLASFDQQGRSANHEFQAALSQARNLKQALTMRLSAMEQIMNAMVRLQEGFFLEGREALKPLTMSEIAEATGFHLSTVSRVLDGLLIEWRGGVIAARELCPRAAMTCQNGPAKPKVVSRIQALLRDEDPSAPLSDRRLSELLVREGIPVSRRVVTKYRQELGAAPASIRRDPR